MDHVIVKEGSFETIKAIDTRKMKLKNSKAKDKQLKKEDDYKMWYIPCGQWFDAGIEDGLIERELTAGDGPDDAPPPGTVITFM